MRQRQDLLLQEGPSFERRAIRARNLAAGAPLPDHHGPSRRDYVLIEIADTGAGMGSVRIRNARPSWSVMCRKRS